MKKPKTEPPQERGRLAVKASGLGRSTSFNVHNKSVDAAVRKHTRGLSGERPSRAGSAGAQEKHKGGMTIPTTPTFIK